MSSAIRAGIDISASGVKAIRLSESARGLILASYAETRLPPGAYKDGEVINRFAVSEAISAVAETAGIFAANVSVPSPKSETAVNDVFAVCDQEDVAVQAVEEEALAMARALLQKEDDSTVLIIDIGRTTTKIAFIAEGTPRFAETIHIGGHALTLAVQKYFGVTETEARRIKIEHGIAPAPGNNEYLSAMLKTVSAIRDETLTRLEHWGNETMPIARGVLIGGNASVRGFPEYFGKALQIPIATGDVFTNLASRDIWMPPFDYAESLAYATAIGLALRNNSEVR